MHLTRQWKFTASILLVTALSASATIGASAVEPATGDPCDQAPPGHDCQVSCVEPHAACAESEKVIDTLKILAAAYAKGDLSTYEKYLDDGCTTFDESTKKLIVGKEAVLAYLKQKFADNAPNGSTPVLSFTIDHPYAKVTGNVAVVNFIAYKEIGGKHPMKEECKATDVFVKHGETWKKLHYRGRWRKIG